MNREKIWSNEQPTDQNTGYTLIYTKDCGLDELQFAVFRKNQPTKN